MSFQILLDKQGFSPGEIDGRAGNNLSHALTAFQTARDVPVSSQADCETWRALGGDGQNASALLTKYTVTDVDMRGPFEKTIPQTLVEQAKLESLGYRAALEMLAERFHVSPQLLQRLNPQTPVQAGAQLTVPAVEEFGAANKPGRTDAVGADSVTITVSREDSSLRVTRSNGELLFFAPVTSGGEHDPLPIGDWKVTGVQWNPVFHYNPDLFWDAKEADSKATLKPGPNNPVGVVWISLNLEHYGLHGTPEPGRIGQTESHGCVRLTNWDAARVATFVKAGTPVTFR